MSNFLRTNERLEAINALKKTSQFLSEIEADIYNWKWVIISYHNAVQNIMILSIKGTNSFNVLTEKSSKKLISSIENNEPYPHLRLDYFLELYKKTKKEEYMKQFINSKVYSSESKVDEAIKVLNRERNKFIHFIPTSLSYSVKDLPKIFTEILTYIRFLILESNNIIFYEKNNKRKIIKLIKDISDKLDEIK